ncbi:MAG: hypothetical protein RSD69_03100 [Bacilli bacterium]
MAFKVRLDKNETENKTIRFPIKLIDRINKEIANTTISFSKFVIQACEYALDNMEKDNKKR